MSELQSPATSPRTPRKMLKDVLLLGTGAASGQAVAMLFSPLLTRLYDTEAFGIFGMFSAIVSTLGALATLRLEQAVLLEDTIEGAGQVLRLCIIATIGVTLLSLLAFIFSDALPMRPVYRLVLSILLEFGAINILALGVFSGLYGWYTRFGSFRALGIYQFARSAIAVFLQLLFCLFGRDARFLITGQVAGLVIATLLLIWIGRPSVSGILFRDYRLPILTSLLDRYRTFPLYGAPQSLLRLLSQNLPALLLPIYFGATQSGLFWLAYRMLILPSQIVIESTRGVLFKDAGQIHRDGGDLRPTMVRTGLYLGCFSAAVSLVLWIAGPPLFALVFGEHWREAGHYAAILSISWAIENALLPASVIISLLELQRVYLTVEVLSLILRAVALYVGSRYGSAIVAIELYMVASVTTSLTNMTYVWTVLSRRARALKYANS